ncbi:MAG TPA: helix-turn-helix domain-containing protein [Vicinamibacterales bacterium]|nr:helix-turn-helix domain-containing protein [Vicinamibacterales bacterium]
MAIPREAPAETLRARKKRQTRERVATVAAGLFRAHGYERVRMRDIAKAADVSEQTLYNYFPTKEHLVFDLDQAFEQRLVNVVRHRGLGTTIAGAVGRDAIRFLRDLLESMDKPTGIPASVALGAALRRVWIELNARAADRLADALREDARERHSPAAAAIAARSIVAVFAVTLEQVGVAALAGTSARTVRRELTATIHTAAAAGTLALGHRRVKRRP